MYIMHSVQCTLIINHFYRENLRLLTPSNYRHLQIPNPSHISVIIRFHQIIYMNK